MEELNKICDAILDYIKSSQSKLIYELWFQDIELLSLTDTEAVVGINYSVKKRFLETKYKPILDDAFKSILGFDIDIKIVLTENADNPEPISISPVPVRENKPVKEESATEQINEPSIISRYTFDNFVVGESNKFVHAACVAVTKDIINESISKTYNPLFIWGHSGLGKTHLLCAITNEIKKKNKNAKIIYKKGEDFTNELISCLQNKTMPQFRDKYRSVDILLIDDIHFIAGKESTQEEFFNTFNKMHDDQKQIILTSDRPPKDIKTLEERLVTRFEWGIIAEINPPSFELRAAIIKKKAEELSITIDNDIVNFLAEKLQSNIRQIEGAIKKIAAISSLTATPITMDMCKRCVADFISGTVPVSVMCDKIIHCVAEKYNVSVEDIKSSKRNKEITNARHIAVYLMKEMTNMTQTSIGDYLDKDHATINFSLKKIKDSIKESKFLESEISELIQKIKS